MKYFVSKEAIVPYDEALDYALAECRFPFDCSKIVEEDFDTFHERTKNLGEFIEMFGKDIIDWFYSDVWTEIEAEDREEAFEKYQKRLEKPVF